MTDFEKIEMVKTNIDQALKDYGRYTNNFVIEDVSNAFVDRLAKDNVAAKADLRAMLRKSPAWNEELDCLVINGTRSHDPEPKAINDLAMKILSPYIASLPTTELDKTCHLIFNAINFFQYGNEAITSEKKEQAIEAINKLAPKAYAEGKKKSRVFMAICKALGLVDNTSGSEFQKNYAKLADELNGYKLDFKLFVGVGAQHFITMSNPKLDRRGSTLTSCHSFNSCDYDYNNGCSGYARDSVTMIAFTVADPDDAETLNNRKTTRQLFMYKPHGGFLLQSRMYNTSGGTRGEQEESKLYRDLIQREISFCEGTTNLWFTRKYHSKTVDFHIDAHDDFGGYPDWCYEDFSPMISVKKERLENFETFEIGASGLCISCGCECSNGLYCDDCDEGGCQCEDCGCRCDEDELTRVYDANSNEIDVCDDCLHNHYITCDYCDYYCHEDIGHSYNDGDLWLCNDCHSAHYCTCSDCGDTVRDHNINQVIDAYFDEAFVCDDCRSDNYTRCSSCGEYVHETNVEDGICTNCQENNEEE